MAVLTAIDEADGRGVMAGFGLGALVRVEGIAGGSVNSNFALHAADGRVFFLRLYEERDLAGAERETAMLARLAAAGVPTPAPLPMVGGAAPPPGQPERGFVAVVRGKPAAVFPWREGGMRCQASVTREDAALVGAALARVHVAGAGEIAEAGRFRFEDLMRRLDGVASSRDARFVPLVPGLRASLERAHEARDRELPGGLTHGDLFRDNVLWTADGRLSALLDFESACAGTYVYDLMVTVLSWTFGDDFDAGLARAMTEGYESARPLTGAEKRALCAEASFAALRFTVTRITDYAMRVTDGPRVVKDWRRFMKRFEKLQALGETGTRALLGV
jgi:homoserine kinase type II